MKRVVVRLSIAQLYWKSNRHGAAVVPMITMISGITSVKGVPAGRADTERSRATCPIGGCANRKIGVGVRLPVINVSAKCSNRRKSSVDTANITNAAAAQTP